MSDWSPPVPVQSVYGATGDVVPQSVSEITTSVSASTTYQNTSGSLKWVTATITDSQGNIQASFRVSPTTTLSKADEVNIQINNDGYSFSVSGFVPDGWYWDVNTYGYHTPDINQVFEVVLS